MYVVPGKFAVCSIGKLHMAIWFYDLKTYKHLILEIVALEFVWSGGLVTVVWFCNQLVI